MRNAEPFQCHPFCAQESLNKKRTFLFLTVKAPRLKKRPPKICWLPNTRMPEVAYDRSSSACDRQFSTV